MKIAIASHGVFPDTIGGMERHTYNLAKHLKQIGTDVTVLAPEPKTGTNYPFPVVHLPWPKRPLWLWSNRDYSKNVAAWIEEAKPDLAFSQGFNLWAYLPKRTIPCIFHPHGLEMFGNLRPHETVTTAPFRALVKKLGRESDATVSLGGRLTRILQERAGIPSEKIFVIPNAVSLEDFPLSTEPREANSFLWVGRLAFNKGIDLLTRAVYRTGDPDFRLTIVGDGPYRKMAEELSKADSRVRYLRKADEKALKEEYAKAETLLFTSRFEGMPTVILEAMASGCAVVATDIGAVEVLVNADNGLVVEPDANSIAEGIRKILALSPEERLKLGRIGRKKAEDSFTWPHLMPKYLEMFRRVRQSRSA